MTLTVPTPRTGRDETPPPPPFVDTGELVPETGEALPSLRSAEGWVSWVGSVDHKQIAIMYFVTTFFFLFVGGIEALLIRWQLSSPNGTVLSPQAYNQVFTMHGTTMIFLVIMPMLIGAATYFVPLMIGARDMAFPRLNALSFWAFAFGGLVLYYSFEAGNAPDVGWFAYAPLTEWPYSANVGVNYWCAGLLILGVGTISSGINIIATVLTLRAPGMTLRRLPLFVWMSLWQSLLIIFALPALNAAVVMLYFDRQFRTHFFDVAHGGSALFWQHAFWSFGHPEVYILILPAWGIISEVIPVFSRKPIFGYSFVAAATAAIGVLSLLVWGHHMFTVGMGHPLDVAFGASSMLIAIPTGIKVFNWTATTWKGSLRFTTSMLFAIAFVVQFTLGGLSGVTMASFPADWQVHDTYYVVAHLHYVLVGGSLFALLAGLFYWFPKMSGKMLSEFWGKVSFVLAFVGFNVTFLPQHILGLIGMVRRIYTYADTPWWHLLNAISSIGAVVLALSFVVLLYNIVHSIKRGKLAGPNPWNAWTLEWATSSPPPPHNFEQVPPIRSRRPLWDMAHHDTDEGRKGRQPDARKA